MNRGTGRTFVWRRTGELTGVCSRAAGIKDTANGWAQAPAVQCLAQYGQHRDTGQSTTKPGTTPFGTRARSALPRIMSVLYRREAKRQLRLIIPRLRPYRNGCCCCRPTGAAGGRSCFRRVRAQRAGSPVVRYRRLQGTRRAARRGVPAHGHAGGSARLADGKGAPRTAKHVVRVVEGCAC
jgi:hypothetical protein